MIVDKVDGRVERSRQTRERLLEAAREILEQDGYAAMSMAAVATAAGVTRRTAYAHFTCRGDLLLGLMRHLGETSGLGETLGSVWQAPDSREAVRRWAHHVATAHRRILAVSRAVERVRQSDTEADRIWESAMDSWLGGATRLAQWLHSEQQLAEEWTVAQAADVIWSLMSMELLERFVHDRGWTTEQYAHLMECALIGTLATTTMAGRSTPVAGPSFSSN